MEIKRSLVCGCWSDVINAVLNKESQPLLLKRLFIGGIIEPRIIRKNELSPTKVTLLSRNYYLGAMFEKVYFTRREAEVMVLIQRGMTNQKAGDVLGLSARTVEFYVQNMRKKTAARNKSELIHLVLRTAFFDSVDFNFPVMQ